VEIPQIIGRSLNLKMSTVSVHVVRYTISSGYRGHVEYILQVLYHGRQWHLRKRYSEFDYFDQKIRRYYRSTLRELPPKTYRYWGRLSDQTIKERLKGLELYLQDLIQTVSSDNTLLCEFLEVDLNLLTFNFTIEKRTSHEVKAYTHQQKILTHFTHSLLHLNVLWRLENCGDLIPSRKRYLNSKKKTKKNSLKNSWSSSSSLRTKKGNSNGGKGGGTGSGGVNDFRMISWVSSSNIDIDDAESLRDSFRESYLSQSDCQSQSWRDRISEEEEESQRQSELIHSISPHDGFEMMNEGAVIEVLSSAPVSIRSSLLADHLITLASNHLLTVTSFPPISDLIVTEFKTHDTITPNSRPTSRSLKRADSSSSPRRRKKAADGEEEALRIRQTKNDSGRDNHPSHTSGRAL
jgi:hypothetical protein